MNEVANNKISKNENQEQVDTETDYDNFLSAAGESGPYQLILFFSTLPFYYCAVFVYFSQLFMTEVSPNHWCWIPELENLTTLDRKTLAIPVDQNSIFGYSQCESYDVNWTEVMITGTKPNSTWKVISCQYGWEFNKSEIPYKTISSENGWVCDKNDYQAIAQAFFFLGCIVGGVTIGWFADRFGRLPALVLSCLIACVGGVATAFTNNLIEFSACRFITGISYDSCMMMAYIIVLEYVSPKHRTMVTCMSFALFYTLSAVILPWIALACDNWRIFALVTSVPMGFAIFTPFFLPESPRWLLSRGRIDETVEKVQKIARINKKTIPIKIIAQFKSSMKFYKEEEHGNFFELFRRPYVRSMFIYLCLQYTFCAIVYDASVRNIRALKMDYFVSFSIMSFTDLPSLVIAGLVMDKLGRRWFSAIVMFITFIFSIVTAFVDSEVASLACAVVAKFTANMAYGVVTQWSPEVLPVSVRASGNCFVQMCCFLGTITSSYIVLLEQYFTGLPMLIVACIAFLGAIFALLLPETAKKDMPRTFEESADLVKQQRFWDIPINFNKKCSKETAS